MAVRSTKKLLEDALLRGGKMHPGLYEYELEELISEFETSMAEDKDEFIFAVTVNGRDVAMVLIERSGQVHINEQAREKLKGLWPAAYEGNMKKLIPTFAKQLEEGEIPVSGVKTERSS